VDLTSSSHLMWRTMTIVSVPCWRPSSVTLTEALGPRWVPGFPDDVAIACPQAVKHKKVVCTQICNISPISLILLPSACLHLSPIVFTRSLWLVMWCMMTVSSFLCWRPSRVTPTETPGTRLKWQLCVCTYQVRRNHWRCRSCGCMFTEQMYIYNR
jgi:hypothetical protein